MLFRSLAEADLHPGDGVLEIGAGLGVVTEWLCRRAGRVVAIEKDARLAAHLRDRFARMTNLELIEADALGADLDALLARGLNKVVANLPFSVGSRLLVDVVNAPHAPERIVITVQKEVADRLTAEPRTKDYGLLGVLAQTRYQVRASREISPTCFLPAPEVWSAIVVLLRREERDIEARDRAPLRALLRLAFGQRRKQLAPLLQRRLQPVQSLEDVRSLFATLGIDARARPEDLAPETWLRLSDTLAAAGVSPPR